MLKQEKIRILVIEDSLADFRLLQEFLSEDSSLDFELKQAQTLRYALSILSPQQFDLVFLDLNLPDGLGLNNLEMICSGNPSVPVIVLTGLDDEKIGIYALQKGAQDYLVKGKIQNDSLVKSIRYAIERKLAGETLRQSEERYRSLFNALTEGFCIIEVVFDADSRPVDYRFLEVNPAFEAQTGLHEAQGRSMRQLTPEHEPFWFEIYGKIALTGEPMRFVNEAKALNRWFEVFAYRVGGQESHKVAILFNDITESKRIEKALSKERENLRTIFDVVNIGLLLIDDEGIVKKVNNTISLWLGKDIPSLQNQQPGNIVGCAHALTDPAGCGHTPHCSTCPIRNTFERVLRSGESVHNVEVRTSLLLNNKNTDLWFEINVDPMILDGKRHAILSMNNITTRKQAEEVLMRDKETFEKLVNEKSHELIKVQLELEQTKRLSDIGTLAATIAHELRNPLAAIKMASYNAQRKAQNPILDKHFSNIEIKLHESENIIDNLLFYSKIRIPHCAPINIYNIFSACIKDARSRFPEYKVSIIRKDTVIKNLLVEADAVQIREIFANLLNNSFDAVGQKGGHIEIKAVIDDGNVNIAVKDNGAGIDKEHLEMIFQPFFSTKAKGTGLGLTVTQQIVKLHGGSINLESQKGKGTTVTIILPLKHNPNA